LPTIEVDREDLESLLGVELPSEKEKLNEILAFVKGEAKCLDNQQISIELKDSNRVDIWGAEGLARALRGFLHLENGLKDYYVADSSGVEVHVDSRLNSIRPYIACAVVKGVKLTNTALRQLMRFQDKMDQNYGRNRRRTSIGLYDFSLITPPLMYGVAEPKEVSFVPLEFEEVLTLEEILERHPKGIEYGNIVRQHPAWPIFTDSQDRVLSFPPIINSNDLGRVNEKTGEVLVEVTGTSYEAVLNTLTNVTLALADRGGSIYSTETHYPYEGVGDLVTPTLKVEVLEIYVDYIRAVIGIKLNPPEIKRLLEKSRYGIAKVAESKITVEVPCYRVDLQHPIDIVEDIVIAYKINDVQPRWPQVLTVGGLSPRTRFRDLVREVMIGLGFQEILSYIMTNPEVLFAKMNLAPEEVVEIDNPKIISMTCLRNWLLPSLMEFLSHNVHIEYPQKIFEVGYCVTHDADQENKTRDLEKIACTTIHSNANFTEAKSMLDAFLANLGLCYELDVMNHDSFIEGRTGRILVENNELGVIGEIHPEVLQTWNLKNPAAAFEMGLDKLVQLVKTKGCTSRI
jgi:phenylalanyl-tRNA synthetase beta chain